jgi:2-polyprenyl-3-methyl-5-hydroxy-6-metoxy-1,4-benzoquinol methylase
LTLAVVVEFCQNQLPTQALKLLGIDLSSKALKVAQLHALETGTSISYELIQCRSNGGKKS